MHSQPTIELLESTHTFPCTFVFKAIGENSGHFVGRVLEAVRRELPEDAEPAFSVRKTSGGRHVSATVEPQVTGAAQVVSIYQNLQEVDGLVFLL